MNRLTAFLFSSLLSVVFLVPCSAADGDTLLIKQNGPFVGRVTIYINAKAMRVEQGRSIRVARAPDWKVSWYNNSRKNYYTQPFAKSLKSNRLFGATSTAITETTKPWQKGKSEKLVGLDTTQWLNVGDATKGAAKADGISKLKYWTYFDKRIPEKSAQFVSSDLGLPYLGGLPVRYSFDGKKSALLPMRSRSSTADEPVGEQIYLETKEVKWVSVPDSTFDIPKGYKMAKDFTEVYLNEMPIKDNAILNDLLKNPDALFNSQ